MQAAVLDDIGAPAPVYQWTTALNGLAVELTEEQHDALVGDARVALVEENAVRPLADVPRAPARALLPRDGAGSGRGRHGDRVRRHRYRPGEPRILEGDRARPDPAPVRRQLRGRARRDLGRGRLLGEDRRRAVLRPRIRSRSAAVGDGALTARHPRARHRGRVGRGRHQRGAGARGRATGSAGSPAWRRGHGSPSTRRAGRLPIPTDDGCATADLVAAIDRATSDRVDVLNLSVGGPSGTIDTVERALLGATEAGVVVTAAAGNDGSDGVRRAPLALGDHRRRVHARRRRVGAVVATRGPRLEGAMVATAPVGPARLVLGADAAAPARFAGRRPGLRARQPRRRRRPRRGRAVRARRRAAGRQVADRAARRRRRHGARQHRGRLDGRRPPRRTDRPPLRPRRPRPARVGAGPPASPGAPGRGRARPRAGPGRPVQQRRRPDLVGHQARTWSRPAPASSPRPSGGWDVVSGTSVATAHVSGVAAVLLGRPGTMPAEVRSALLTSTAPIGRHSGLRAGHRSGPGQPGPADGLPRRPAALPGLAGRPARRSRPPAGADAHRSPGGPAHDHQHRPPPALADHAPPRVRQPGAGQPVRGTGPARAAR